MFFQNLFPENNGILEQGSGNSSFWRKKSSQKLFRNSEFPEPFPQWKWKKFQDSDFRK